MFSSLDSSIAYFLKLVAAFIIPFDVREYFSHENNQELYYIRLDIILHHVYVVRIAFLISCRRHSNKLGIMLHLYNRFRAAIAQARPESSNQLPYDFYYTPFVWNHCLYTLRNVII